MCKNFFLYLTMMPLLMSCSSDLVGVPEDRLLKSESQEMASFNQKLDSISEEYFKLNIVASSRGYGSNYAIDTAADAVGAYIGGKLFSWVGASIGAACGNPAIAVGGYLVGRKAGSAAGSAAASIGSAWARDHWFSRSSTTHGLVLNENYVVSIEDPNNLSEGELHNLIVFRLLKTMDKYETLDGNLNCDLLVADALEYEKELCPDEEFSDEFTALWLPKTVEQTKRIVSSSILLTNNSSDDFLDDVYNNLIPEINITKVEFDNANILNKKTLTTYMLLDDNYIVDYSKDIDKVIDNSNFNQGLKNDLKNSNSVLLNSTLIWREVQ